MLLHGSQEYLILIGQLQRSVATYFKIMADSSSEKPLFLIVALFCLCTFSTSTIMKNSIFQVQICIYFASVIVTIISHSQTAIIAKYTLNR